MAKTPQAKKLTDRRPPNMTIERLARTAGVSPATAWRVLNKVPNIEQSMVDAVHRAVAETQFTLTRRRRSGRTATAMPSLGKRVGFFVVGYHPGTGNAAYEQLLLGVSRASEEYQLELQVAFINADADLSQRILNGRLDGVVLHGTPPGDEDNKPLRDIPTVWLMGNRRRPSWGDHVMPDNDAIGRIAAHHLLGQGHREVVYLGLHTSWFYHIRASAFRQVIEDAGGHVNELNERIVGRMVEPVTDERRAINLLLKLCRSGRSRPTAIFVADDWMLPRLYTGLSEVGLRVGTDLSVVSCNNDRAQLAGLTPKPATIDIHFDRIAHRATEQLALLIRHPRPDDPVQILIRPHLVLP